MGACTDCEKHTKNKYIWSFDNDNSNLTNQLAAFRHVSYGQSKAYLSLPVNMFAGSETYTLRFQSKFHTIYVTHSVEMYLKSIFKITEIYILLQKKLKQAFYWHLSHGN